MRRDTQNGRSRRRNRGLAALAALSVCVFASGCGKTAPGPSVAVGTVTAASAATVMASATPAPSSTPTATITVTPTSSPTSTSTATATSTSSPTASPTATAATASTMEESGGLALALTTAAYTSATADEVVRMVVDGQPDARQKAFALAVFLAKFEEELSGAGDVAYADEVLENLRGVGLTMGGWMSGEIGETDLPAAMAPWQAAGDQVVSELVDELVRRGVPRADVDAFVAEVMGTVLPGE